MISPITWFWNFKHRKLIQETKAIIRFYEFLRYDCGLKDADKLSTQDLKPLLKVLKKRNNP